ncbi:N-acetylneuraminic acid mutarotase [Catalinimonas alkaloidigena]|uniref:Kelch repeat-containing protein n=1 Tax=Catalinimonas alkaloidigena TaxID=1075417 RepID=UPI0024065814|nr:hypothetical protein [Catalinimonas alkaloidigena]MDF9799559.1 N-acetylneuraminic acid mutarotase [Catalinimonas alkaloidigena]
MKIFISSTLLFIFCFFILLSCREDDEVISTPPIATDSTLTIDLSGYVQKGPFINGTAITLGELNENLLATGKNFTTQINDNKGAFNFKEVPLNSPFVQLQANGFYFDEVKGEKSAAQLTIFGLAKVTDATSVNVNLLSYLEFSRVAYLMQEEESAFEEAKQKAQKEILTIFGIETDSIGYSETLDISHDGDDNAILLAISAILQANNTVAELSELLANLITDLKEDGVLNSETTKTKLREQAMSLNLPQIRAHLEKRYADMGVEASIPNFEQYIDSDGDGILNKDEDDTPEDFTFTLQNDVAINTKVISNAVKISGLKEGGTADAVVQNGHILLNDKLVEDSVTQVKNGDQLQLQLTSGSDYMDTVSTKITIGTLVKSFTAISDNYIPEAFSFTAQKDVAVDSFYTSNTITVSGIPYETPLKIEDGIIIKNGKELESDTTSVKNGDELAVKLLSSSEFEASTSALVDINGISASFSITTDDYSPDPFSFTPIENAKRDSVYTSNTITISGLPHPTPIGVAQFSTDNGIIYVNGNEYLDNTFSLKNGDEVFIKISSSKEFSSITNASLSINNIISLFQVTTEQNPLRVIDNNIPFKYRTNYDGIYLDRSLYIITGDKLYEFSLTDKTWNKKANYPGGYVDWLTFFSINNKLYAGLGWDDPKVAMADKNFWEYDPNTNIWKEVASFPGRKRYSAKSFVVGKKAYVGLGNSGDPSDILKDIWEYNPETNLWTQITNYPGNINSSNDRIIAQILNSNMFIGSPIVNESSSTFELEYWQYDINNNAWKKRANNHHINTTANQGFVLYDKGYILSKNSLSFYNYDTNIWSKSIYLPFSDTDLKIIFTSPKSIYFINGYSLYEFTPPQE